MGLYELLSNPTTQLIELPGPSHSTISVVIVLDTRVLLWQQNLPIFEDNNNLLA